MGAEVAVGAALGLVASSFINKKAPKAPKAVEPPTVNPAQVDKKAKGLAAKQKQQAVGAYGSMDTLLTGPQGLGSVSSANKSYSSLLG